MSNDIWDHSLKYTGELKRRAKDEDPVLTCERQLLDILSHGEVDAIHPVTLLDAGCGTGYYYRTLKALPVVYHGIDSCAPYIELGKQIMPEVHGLPPERLRTMRIEDLHEEDFDIVVCFNTLLYCANYHEPLERLTDAAGQLLVIRTLLGPDTEYRWEEDGYLDDGWNHLKAYFNIYEMDVVKSFIVSRGFDVEQVVDRRTNDEVEIVIGKPHPWRILVCRRR